MFVYRAFVHVPTDKQSKIDSKARECILLRYELDDFGYKFYDPRESKTVRSHDIISMEDQTTKDIKGQTEWNPIQKEEEEVF